MSSLPVKEWSNWETWDWVAFSVLKPQQLIHWWEPLTTCPRSEYMNMATTLNPTFGHWDVFYTKWLPYRVHLYVNVTLDSTYTNSSSYSHSLVFPLSVWRQNEPLFSLQKNWFLRLSSRAFRALFRRTAWPGFSVYYSKPWQKAYRYLCPLCSQDHASKVGGLKKLANLQIALHPCFIFLIFLECSLHPVPWAMPVSGLQSCVATAHQNPRPPAWQACVEVWGNWTSNDEEKDLWYELIKSK